MHASSGAEVAAEVLGLQEKRALRYSELNRAHKEYLADGYNLDKYKLVVCDATNVFKEVSEQILAAKKRTEDDQLALMIDKLQVLEEQNLRVTVDHQLSLQQAQEEGDDELQQRNVRGLRKRLDDISGEIREVLEEIRYKVHDDK